MSKKIAKLVTVSVTTRVVVDEGATDEQIMEVALPKQINNLQNDGCLDHLESIEYDTECPYGTYNNEPTSTNSPEKPIFSGKKGKEAEYKVTVIRTGWGSKTITVRATSEQEAHDKALNEAGGYEFSEHSSDYEVDDVVKREGCEQCGHSPCICNKIYSPNAG